MNLETIREQIIENVENGRSKFDGLSSADIGRYNRARMFGDFGDNDEAFPSQEEWSRIVD